LALTFPNLSRPETLSRYFFYVGLFNMVIAAAVTVPVLIPQLGLPLKLQIWPGTWMFVAYFSFLIAGVVGFVTWSLIYYLISHLFGRQRLSPTLSLFHLVAFEAGVFGATALMGIFPGYWGGTYIHDGVGQFVVTRIIEWAVIPIGVFLAVALLATLTGVLNVILSSPD
jgi:hypothetical protein